MAVVLNTTPFVLSTPTALKLVTMVSMRLPESETTKLWVPVATRVAPVLLKTAPLQLPPIYALELIVPDPVVGSNEVVVPTTVLVLTLTGFAVPETRATVLMKGAPQKFPAASRVNRAICV
jgi:hypothetical protein